MYHLREPYTVSQIKNKSIKGVKWVGLAEIIVRLVQVITTIILAKLLGPTTFGTFGICLILFRLANVIGDFGFGAAIIQKKDIGKIQIDTIFSLCLIFSTILCLTTYFLADYVQHFFSFKDLAKPIKILSFLFIIVAFSIILRSLFIRNLNFDKLSIFEVLSFFFNSIIAILLAYKGMGIWSLIIGLYIENILLTILLFFYVNWIPNLRISFTCLKEILPFAFNVILARLAYFFNSNIGNFFVGKFLGQHYLGIYLIAYSFIDMPVQRISKNVTKVTFSTLSKFQDNLMEFKKTYKAINYYLSLIIFPLFIGLFIVAPEFIRTFYGHQWEEMILPLRILCFTGIFRSLLVISSTTLFAINKPDVEVKIAFFQGFLLCTLIILWLRSGIIGVSMAVTAAYLIGSSTSLILTLSAIRMRLREYIKLILNPFVGSVFIILIWLINSFTLKNVISDLIFMIMNIVISSILFIIYICIIDRSVFSQFRKILLTTYE
ncbi:MAG: lipopolysaccharide biosynthesis protein [Candidatus Hodarchaeota archaeon]